MSESYRALTRKYRPRSFDDVVSQEHIINTLRNAIDQNRISHAYLFCGPRGVGKTTMARVVARMINGVGLDVDGEELGRTLDIIEIDAASNSGVDDVRSLREGVRVPPQSGKYKVYIIDEVHMLSKPAFNALLKTLEEPPEHAKFIFATTEPHKVLATVLSRVQRFDFRRIKVSEMVDRLRYICNEEKIRIDDESLHLIGRKADGALRDALSILDQVIAFCGDDIQYAAVLEALNAISNDKLFELVECTLTRDSAKGMHIIHELLLQGHDIQEFLVSLTEHLRNMYFSRFATTEGTLLEVTADEKNRLKEAAKDFTEQDMLRMMHLASEAQMKIRDSQQPRVLLEITILKLIMMDRAEGLNELLAELRELKKKTDLTGTAGNSRVPGTDESSEKAAPGEPIAASAKPVPDKNPDPVQPKPETRDPFFGKPAIRKPGNNPGGTNPTEPKGSINGNGRADTAPVQEPASSAPHTNPRSSDAPAAAGSLPDTDRTNPAEPKGSINENGQADTASVQEPASSAPHTNAASSGAPAASSVPDADRDNPEKEAPVRDQHQDGSGHADSVEEVPAKPYGEPPSYTAGDTIDQETDCSSGTDLSPDPGDDEKTAFEPPAWNPLNQGASIRKPKSRNLLQNGAAESSHTSDKPAVNGRNPEPVKNAIPRELIESRYQQWIEQVRAVAPQFVALSLIKTRLFDTGEDFVVIECQDKLVEQLIDEHSESLTTCLEKVIERNVSIRTKVLITESTPSGNDPYASLKQLQEINPVVKTIVDVLGAELEY